MSRIVHLFTIHGTDH